MPIQFNDTYYIKKCVSDGVFQQTKVVRSQQHVETGKINGFRKFDKVRYFGKEYFIKGRMSTGYAILSDIEGEKIDFSFIPKGKKTPKFELIKRVTARSETLITIATNKTNAVNNNVTTKSLILKLSISN